jgi:hypothetical protein
MDDFIEGETICVNPDIWHEVVINKLQELLVASNYGRLFCVEYFFVELMYFIFFGGLIQQSIVYFKQDL